ncbi:MAG: hypothetical protein HOL40_08270 [Cellvibrionales bacterium]|nr:hypothetical protein [Cellvibrionales bacterium]
MAVIHFTDTLGMIANISSNVAFVPQIIKSYRCKNVTGLSMGMFALLFLTQLCWIGYAIPIGAKQLWISSLTEIVLLLPIFILWWRYSGKEKQIECVVDMPLEIVSDS